MHAPYGYYSVNNKKFISKLEAFIHASAVGSAVSFHYFDDVWEAALSLYKYNPHLPLETLYKERALRIREQYDYVILNFSGGADSTTILETFLKNNIKLDEIYVRFPRQMIGKYTPNINDRSPTNMLSEWDFSIKPKLDYVRHHYPDIKIVVYDWIETLKQVKISDDILLKQNHNFGLANFGFNENVSSNAVTLSDKGLKVANIIGTDKPAVLYDPDSDKYQTYFVDIISTADYQHLYGRADPGTRVDFYYDSQYPEITLARAHAVANYFKNNPKERYMIDQSIRKKLSSLDYIKMHYAAERIVNQVCYVNWDLNTFQVGKPDNRNKIYHPWFNYVHLTDEFDSLKKSLVYNYDSISSAIREDLKYLDEQGKMVGLRILLTKQFQLNI